MTADAVRVVVTVTGVRLLVDVAALGDAVGTALLDGVPGGGSPAVGVLQATNAVSTAIAPATRPASFMRRRLGTPPYGKSNGVTGRSAAGAPPRRVWLFVVVLVIFLAIAFGGLSLVNHITATGTGGRRWGYIVLAVLMLADATWLGVVLVRDQRRADPGSGALRQRFRSDRGPTWRNFAFPTVISGAALIAIDTITRAETWGRLVAWGVLLAIVASSVGVAVLVRQRRSRRGPRS
jgi:hypothetical protein